MKIFDAKKIEIADVPVTKNAKHEQELMKSDYIRLEWSQEEYMPLPVGAYIEHEGVKYSLFGQYVPDNNGGVYQYKPEFQHPMMLLAHTPCLLTTRDSVGKEIKQTDWTYTGILSTILGRLQGIIYDQLGIMLTFETKFKPTTDVEESATCTFSGVDIISAFSEVCNQFGGIEYHIDWEGKTVWFGDIFLGDEVSLEEGGNVGMASKSMNSKDYANYFIVRGGTRNITNKTASGDNVQSDSRLSIYDIDKRANEEQPKVQKVLIFDHIYPQLDLYVYNVRKRVRRLKDEDKQYVVKSYNADGSVAEYKTYAVYYMRLAYKEGEAWKDYTINNPSDDIVAGKKLTASFEPNEKGTHSQLAGREYELIYHKADKTIIANPTIGDSGVNILAGDYEIVFEQDGDLIIPNIDTLQPWGNSTPDDTCDKVVLYNIVMSDEYITNAKVRLAEEAEKEIARQYTDKTNYTVNSNPIEFAEQNPGLSIGRAVRYRTLSGEVMSTRINRLVTQLDYPIEQEITLGNAVIKGNTQQLKEDVKSISVAIDVNESSATRINSMLNSMMRELMEYDAHLLHRDRDDETAYKLTVGELLVKGIAKILSNVSVGGKVSTNGINNDGDNVTKGLTTLHGAICSNIFKGSMTAGSGWKIDANGNAQVESIEVRSYMRVLELVMNRLSAEESEFVFTESGTVETATLNEDGSYTLVMRKKTDKDITAFQVGDVLKGVVNNLAEQGAVGVKYYTSWVLVEDVDNATNSINVSVYKDEETPDKQNFPPCALMVLHRWGNADETKKERQSCWYISSIEKRIVMLDGVTKPIKEEKNYASFYGLPFDMNSFKGYSLNADQPYLYVRGALLQDVCFIDYKGQIVKQERYRGVWSKEVAESNDPYIVKETTFDTVYHKNAKWQCTSTTATTAEPSTATTDWIRLTEETTGSDGKSAAKAYVTSNDIAIPTDADGIVSEDFSIGNTFTLMVDGKKCTDLKVTMNDSLPSDTDTPFSVNLSGLWLTISSSKGTRFGSLARTLHFTVTGTLDGDTYTDIVTILVRPNKKGEKGEDGKNLTKVSNFYKWGASGTEAPSGEYTKDAIPEHVEGLDYLWNYEECYNDAGETISTSEKTCIGNFARGIESITEYYQIGTEEKPTNPIKLDSNNTPNTSGWQTTMPSLTAEKRYLWNQEVVKFTDGTYSVSEVHLAGAQGESITIEQKLVYYAISASGTRTPPDDWFDDTVKEPTEEKPYLWTCVSVRYSDTTVVKYYTVARRGQKGDPGKDGRNLTKVVNYYKWGNSGTEVPIGEYTKDAIPQHTDGLDYLWNYEECYSHVDNTDVLISQSGKTCIGYFPKDGIPGKEGKGIVSITEYYQIGTEKKPTKGITVNSDNVLDTTGWKPTMDSTTNENRFVWNQEVILFTDGKYSISAIHLAGAQGADGIDGADGALPNLFGYDTKVECLVGHHNVVHTKTGFALVLDSISDDDTSSDRYCLLRIKNITAGEGTYSISGYITHGRGGKFEFDCGDVTPQTMYLTANKRTRFEKKFVLPKNSYKHVDFEFFAGGYIVNIEELKIERTDNVVSECTPFVTLAHDSITQKQNILLDTNFIKTSDRTIWSVFNGDIVENAYNGLSAFHYKDSRSATITTAVEILSQKFVGKLKPSTWYTLSMFTKVKGKVIPYIGNNVTRNWNQTGKNKGADAVLCDEYIVSTSNTTNAHQLEESTEYKRHSITFLTAPDLTNADERMYFYIWAQAEIYVTMLKLEECEKPTDWQLNEADRKGEKGDKGKTGKPLAGPTMWDSSVWYMSGKGDDEAYQSIVINPKNPKQMYLCGYSHTNVEPSTSTSVSSVDSCTSSKPWVQVAYQDFVATKVLFAERGKIENLDITNATIQGTITDMAVKTKAEWDAITNALVPKADEGKTEVGRKFQIVDPSKAGSYFIPTIDPTSSDDSETIYDRGPQIVFLPTYSPTSYDIITCMTEQTGAYKTYNIPKYQTAGTHIRITKGGAPRRYLRWAYLEDAGYDRLWTSGNTINRQTIRDIYNLGTLICADNKIFRVYNGNDKQTHNIQGAWYYGDSDYKHGRFSVNGTVARMLWLMPGQTVELVSQIEEINRTKCLVWSVVNSSDFTAVNINADFTKRYKSDTNSNPREFHGESGILDPALAGNADNWEDCFMAHRKIDNLLLGGKTNEVPSLFINRNNLVHNSTNYSKDDDIMAEFYIPS